MGILFTLPLSRSIGSLLLIPIGQTFYYSFTNWDGFTSQWIGFAAYRHLFQNPEFSQVLENNAVMVLAIPVAIALPLGVAFLLNTQLRGWRFFRSVFFLPTAVSWVVIAFVARRFFDPDKQGILQSLLDHIGLGFWHPDLLAHEHSALAAVMITFIWSVFGTNMIIFLAGMSTIDQEIYDAAKVDGAGSFTVMVRITFPLLKRFVQFAFIISLITAFSALFSLIIVMTERWAGLRLDDARVLHLRTGVHREQLRRRCNRRRHAFPAGLRRQHGAVAAAEDRRLSAANWVERQSIAIWRRRTSKAFVYLVLFVRHGDHALPVLADGTDVVPIAVPVLPRQRLLARRPGTTCSHALPVGRELLNSTLITLVLDRS